VDDEQGDRRRRHRCEYPGAVPPGTLVASPTGLKPAIDLLDMLATPAGGARPSWWPWRAGGGLSAPLRFRWSILLEGKPPTGEPDAGDPPVRFGGRGDRDHSVPPTPIIAVGETYGHGSPQDHPGPGGAGHRTGQPLRGWGNGAPLSSVGCTYGYSRLALPGPQPRSAKGSVNSRLRITQVKSPAIMP